MGDLFKRVLEERKNSAFSANPDRESPPRHKTAEGWVGESGQSPRIALRH